MHIYLNIGVSCFVLVSTRVVLVRVTLGGPVYHFMGFSRLETTLFASFFTILSYRRHMMTKESPSCRFSLQSIHWLEHTICSPSVQPGLPIFRAGCHENRFKDQPGWKPTCCTIKMARFYLPNKQDKHDSNKKAMATKTTPASWPFWGPKGHTLRRMFHLFIFKRVSPQISKLNRSKFTFEIG